MLDTLKVGIENEAEYAVTEDMSPPHLPVKVLATPEMIRLIEGTCLMAAQPHLEEGETTVGVHVCVSHTGPARPGESVRVRVRLKEIRKRRLVFETEVRAPGGAISEGTHERSVIDTRRFR